MLFFRPRPALHHGFIEVILLPTTGSLGVSPSVLILTMCIATFRGGAIVTKWETLNQKELVTLEPLASPEPLSPLRIAFDD